MASQAAMAMRSAKAAEEHNRQLAELNRKIELVMAKLGIEDVPQVELAESARKFVIADVPPVELAESEKGKKKN